ncbi:MAG: hypothetical protein LC793_04075 [Thermomicrobia bacterium]|nr:hypothetical protein [Thermomicrobia bacterium]
MASEQQQPKNERRFRAVDVLTGTIDRTQAPRRVRKQISAYLYPEQVQALGELHARLNSTADGHVEKSEIVGLALDLLAALVAAAERDGFTLTTLAATRERGETVIGKGT